MIVASSFARPSFNSFSCRGQQFRHKYANNAGGCCPQQFVPCKTSSATAKFFCHRWCLSVPPTFKQNISVNVKVCNTLRRHLCNSLRTSRVHRQGSHTCFCSGWQSALPMSIIILLMSGKTDFFRRKVATCIRTPRAGHSFSRS